MQQETTRHTPRQTLASAAKTREERVRCNGGAAGQGHPAVYLTLNDEGFVVCPYCSRRFEKDSRRQES